MKNIYPEVPKSNVTNTYNTNIDTSVTTFSMLNSSNGVINTNTYNTNIDTSVTTFSMLNSSNGVINTYTYTKTYIILGTEIILNNDTTLGIVIALINTLGFEIYDSIRDNCQLPSELNELMEKKRISYNRKKNIDIVLK